MTRYSVAVGSSLATADREIKMPLDASIYGQIQQPQQQNPLNALAQAYQIKGYQAQMDKADRAEQQQNKLLQLVGSPEFSRMDAQGKAGALQGVGDFENAGRVITSAAAANKDQREAEKVELAMAIDRYQQSSGAFAEIAKNPAAAQRILGQMVQAKVIDPKYAQQVLTSASQAQDPAQFWMQGANAAISAKDKLTLQMQQRGQDITRQNSIDSNATSAANNANTVGATLRGQNMTDTRAREANQNGRIPTGYRQTADGTLEFIPGGPADPASKAGGGKPLTEGQSKALLFGTRMKESNEILEGLASGPDGVDRPSNFKRVAELVPGVMGGGALTAVANVTQSDKQQQVEQAQRDFLNAVLRRESGAVIGESEFESGRKQYFPAIGDSDAVKAQKKRNREVAMRGILEEVPDGESRVAKVRGPKASGTAATPPAAAIAYLKANPGMRAQFEAKYGTSADAYLGK